MFLIAVILLVCIFAGLVYALHRQQENENRQFLAELDEDMAPILRSYPNGHTGPRDTPDGNR